MQLDYDDFDGMYSKRSGASHWLGSHDDDQYMTEDGAIKLVIFRGCVLSFHAPATRPLLQGVRARLIQQDEQHLRQYEQQVVGKRKTRMHQWELQQRRREELETRRVARLKRRAELEQHRAQLEQLAAQTVSEPNASAVVSPQTQPENSPPASDIASVTASSAVPYGVASTGPFTDFDFKVGAQSTTGSDFMLSSALSEVPFKFSTAPTASPSTSDGASMSSSAAVAALIQGPGSPGTNNTSTKSQSTSQDSAPNNEAKSLFDLNSPASATSISSSAKLIPQSTLPTSLPDTSKLDVSPVAVTTVRHDTQQHQAKTFEKGKDDDEEDEFGSDPKLRIKYPVIPESNFALWAPPQYPSARLLTTARLIHCALDVIVDTHRPVINALEEEIDRIEDLAQTLSIKEHKAILVRISAVRRKCAVTRQWLWSKRDVLTSLLSREWREFLTGLDIPYLRDVYDHNARMTQKLTVVSELLGSLQELYLATVNIGVAQSSQELNIIMKNLNSVATIFMPLSLIPGLMGMNCAVPFMVGLEDLTGVEQFKRQIPFIAVCAIIMVLCYLGIVMFRKRGWLTI